MVLNITCQSQNSLNQSKEICRSKICPDYLEVRQSNIKNAGLGVFATKTIAANKLLGTYDGEWIDIREFKTWSQEDQEKGFEYGWEIHDFHGYKKRPSGLKLKDGGIIGYIDAKNPKCSNFLRYVNHPPNNPLCSENAKSCSNIGDQKQITTENVRSYQMKDKIYYITTREIRIGEELYVDYGPEYAALLLSKEE